jgi:hypothetical protein
MGFVSAHQTAQLVINGRVTDSEGRQYYVENTYNVAYGDPISPEIFVVRAPARRFSMATDLF